ISETAFQNAFVRFLNEQRLLAPRASPRDRRLHTHKAMTFIAVVGLLLILDVLWTHRQLRRAIVEARPERRRLDRYPSISVIRPVRGRDVDAAANFAAALDTGYPGSIETIFVVDDESDPSWPLLHQAVLHRPDARLVVAGPPPQGRTGKLNAMIIGLAA